MGVCLKTMTVTGILSLSSHSTSHISVSIISLAQMIRCAGTIADVKPEWLNHKVTQMKELIGLAIMMCVKWVAYGLWHWSVRILLKFACDSLTHCSDSCFTELIFMLSGSNTVDRSARLIWLGVLENWYLSDKWGLIRDGCQGKEWNLNHLYCTPQYITTIIWISKMLKQKGIIVANAQCPIWAMH